MNSKKILTKEVLQVLGLGALVVASAAMPGLPKALIEIHKSFRDVNRKDFGRIIHRLSNQKMLSITARLQMLKLLTWKSLTKS